MRDSGKKGVTVGARFAILSPKPVGILKNGASLIQTGRPFEMLSGPPIPMKPYEPHKVKREMTFFVLKQTEIKRQKLGMPVAINTLCSAETCDRIKAGTNVAAQCACFAQYSRNGSTARNVCIKLDFSFQSNGERVSIDNFTSLRTSRLLFDNETISVDCQTLHHNNIATEIAKTWKKIVKHVNENGGWTIMGWFVRAIKNEEDKQENDEDAMHESIKTNITYLYPTTLKHENIPPEMLVRNVFIQGAVNQTTNADRDASQDNL
ncbi:hypothetical protein SEMRO_3168_G344680.1 [Seminavis robusta]|uniref:Uncharacterized protein n=1 Tax=Seminavis robusta TaxID=568900 RepID=A0A9N8F571_9STRA|nr:hypothetical protein SEMRO_3168_G344680.1 [Seminavis robusta]|eukprot:Sro3168_g344680.1 n/a (264) ;mRNA; f:1072-1863